MGLASFFGFARTGSARRHPAPRPRRRGRAPAIEPLEDRCLPAGWFGPPVIGETANVNGTLFFSVAGPEGGQLWKSDGTPKGTILLRTFTGSPFIADAVYPPTNLTAVNGTLFFTAVGETTGEELWKSDGTPEGTVLVKDIYPGPAPNPMMFSLPNDSSPSDLTNVNGTLYFTAFHPDTGREIWKSDGTESGTVLVKDVNPGTASSDARNYTLSGGTLFFTAMTAEHGFELWKTDGTATGTVLVKDINPGSGSSLGVSEANLLVDAEGILYFNPFTPDLGRELWRSDGTADGTFLVKDINPGTASSFPLTAAPQAIPSGTYLIFAANDGVNGNELWASDGTAEGTVLWMDLNPGAASSNPRSLSFANGYLFFVATHPESGVELWSSDFTAAGTRVVRDINPGAGDSSPFFLTVVNDTLFFRAFSPDAGEELWRSDGTETGTTLVRDITPGSASTQLTGFTSAGDRLFFVVSTSFSSQLWVSDGTASGTVLIKLFPFEI